LPGTVPVGTGACRGIRAAIVRRVTPEGATVAFTWQSSQASAKELAETIGGRTLALQADASDPTALAAAIDEAARVLGKIDFLVNNAAVLLLGPIDSFSLEDFDKTLEVNVRAVFVAAK